MIRKYGLQFRVFRDMAGDRRTRKDAPTRVGVQEQGSLIMIKKLITAVAGAAALSVALGATAQADMAYAPEELSTEQGAANLYQRIQATAETQCDSRLNHDSVIKYRAVRDRCVSDVVDDLVHKVNDPRLEKIHNERKNSV